MITIKDIARLAGTSRGTVDRVLNKRGNVKPEVEQRVLEIVEEYNYKSNPFAKALVSNKKYRIGVVINAKDNKFFDDVLVGIHETINKYRTYGFEVVIREIKGYKESEQLNALDSILQNDLDALAITPINTAAVAERLSSLSPLPIVTLNSDIHIKKKLAYIGCDYLNSGQLSGDIANLMLPGGGKTSIITGSFHMLGHNERIEGFKASVGSGGPIHIVSIDENNDDNETSYAVTRDVIEKHGPQLIYFCAAGTEGGVKAVIDAKRDIKVIVVDDIGPMRAYLSNGAIQAIITQQPYLQGAVMVETLYDYLISGKKPERVHNYMENHVKLRHSK